MGLRELYAEREANDPSIHITNCRGKSKSTLCHPDPDFLSVAPSMTACAAFSKESRMRSANANELHRKSGGAQPRDLQFSSLATKATGGALICNPLGEVELIQLRITLFLRPKQRIKQQQTSANHNGGIGNIEIRPVVVNDVHFKKVDDGPEPQPVI